MSSTQESPTAESAGHPPRRRRLWPQFEGGLVIGMVYATIWLVMLIMPVVATALSDAALGWKLTSYAATVVFGVLYCWVMAWWMSEEGYRPTALRHTVVCLVLAALTALALPAAGSWVVVFLPFISALVIFTAPLRAGITVGIAIWLIPSVVVYLVMEQQIWVIAGPGFGMLFIIFSRLAEHFEERTRQAQYQLRQVEERDQIARDVHDVLGHSLTVLSIKAQVARRLMDTEPQNAQAELDEIEHLSRESLAQVRSTVNRLKAPQLPGELEVARSALEAAGIATEIRAEGGHSESPLFAWVLREAVTNVLRHSQATRCVIEISADGLHIYDDGLGLGKHAEGHGLGGLRERAHQEGARVVIADAHSTANGTTVEQPGTQIEVSLP